MTDSDRSLSEVPGLIEERRRYEGWLAALEARKESTPGHVFQRVQGDYRARLERVAEQLASYRQAIEEERASVQSRVTLLDAEEQLQRDERAELELRAHVGELSGEDATAAFSAVDETIERLVGEKGALNARIAELQGLLDAGAPSARAQEARPTMPEPAESTAEVAAEPVDQAAAEPSTPEPAPLPEPEPAPAAAEQARPKGVNGSFDELAFLSSVVGKEGPDRSDRKPVKEAPASAAPARDQQISIERRSTEPLLRPSDVERDDQTESLLAGLDQPRRGGGEHPLAANVSANNPIVLRTAGTIEQSKTLKCNECGSMNYPTEWYCERCGAELAAL
jgi:hypothetical protein